MTEYTENMYLIVENEGTTDNPSHLPFIGDGRQVVAAFADYGRLDIIEAWRRGAPRVYVFDAQYGFPVEAWAMVGRSSDKDPLTQVVTLRAPGVPDVVLGSFKLSAPAVTG
jgi:hypothetical protein